MSPQILQYELSGAIPVNGYKVARRSLSSFAARWRGGAGEVTFAPSEIEGYRHGEVGWAATKLTISLSDGRRVEPRWTAVVVNQGGWKFVQTHASIPVPNDQVGWTYGG